MISAVVLALASVMSLLAGAKMIVRRTCSPLKAVHRRNLTPEGERRLSLVCGPALLVVGASFAASACLAAFAGDAAGGAQAIIGVAGIALPALAILLAIRRCNGSVAFDDAGHGTSFIALERPLLRRQAPGFVRLGAMNDGPSVRRRPPATMGSYCTRREVDML